MAPEKTTHAKISETPDLSEILSENFDRVMLRDVENNVRAAAIFRQGPGAADTADFCVSL